MGNPYYRNEEVATVLAQICCFNNQLPQGAPTSPVVSNMICARLDAKLQQLAKKHRSTYTRYADDITFSTTQVNFPNALAFINEEGETLIGSELLEIISDNHFEVNPKKVRLQLRNKRQEVTGLTVNRFPNVQRKYISQIRGMLFAWRKFGLETTQARYLQFYYRRHRNPDYPPPDFRKVVQGKIEFVGMIRGKNNPIYIDLCNRLWKLAPELAKRDDSTGANGNTHDIPAQKALVITEGKTDWKHLKAALISLKEHGLFSKLDISFQEEETPKEAGAAWLLRTCKSLSTVQHPLPTICIFDRDIEGNKKKVTDEVGDYKDWGNNVHSLLLPIPKHRQATPDISIEFLYCDDDLQRIDASGRRLFLSNEFNLLSGRHLTLDLVCTNRHKLQSTIVKVIDNDVYDRENKNVALSKNDFADHILNCDPEFTSFDFSEFGKVFEMINEIVSNGDV